MIVYHGTSEQRGQKILADKLIKHKVDRVHTLERTKTTDGYIYVSDKFSVSAYFGNLATIIEDTESPYFFIFEIEIHKNELLPDLDETNPKINLYLDESKSYENLGAEQSFKLFHSASIKRNLKLGVEVKRYMKLPSSSLIGKTDRDLREFSLEIVRSGKNKEDYPLENVMQRFSWISVG
ncbi:hypothetical protein [Bacillus subtilis]|uniref:hypothetical protein n=1 Tax=Bacillus subtilis TaxID=1423 RepID=UPI001366F5DB|nr:hypothetical protein [Bacillus subtilis]MBU8707955.1 hypothetical protein [Bacillus subtilis]QHM15349.1 hypothetical protein C7M29_03052 [Bacillus subtilis]